MTLPIELSRPARTRADQTALVEAVRDAAASEQETNYLEWKGSLDLGAKSALAKIGGAVLGFSNRMPDVAARACGGCAYMLVGVEPGAVAGVTPVDAAKLEAGLAPYVGANVQWRPDYVEVDGRAVLVVTVEPPQWGEPGHPVRKSFHGDTGKSLLVEGAILVRHHASTEPAKATDIDALNRRALRRSDNELAVDVRLLDETPLRRVDLREETLGAFVNGRREIMLSALNRSNPLNVLGIASVLQEHRSEDVYRKEVGEYADQLAEALPDVLLARSVLHDAGLLKLVVANSTERTFTGVRVKVTLPGEIEVRTWKREVNDEVELPRAPVLFGRGNASVHGLLWDLGGIDAIPQMKPLWTPDAESDGSKTTVVFSDTEVRAEGTHQLPGIWLLLDDEAPGEVVIQWQATAKEATKRLSGTVTVPVAPRLMEPTEVLADAPED